MKTLVWLAGTLLLSGCPEHGSGGPDGGGSGRVCGGRAGTPCSSNELCDFGRNSCGVTDEEGTCRPRPDGCADIFDPVCGCDNEIHGNECDANSAGVDVKASGTCPLMPGTFACGFRTCATSSEYCQRAVSDVGGEPDSFSCKPLPGACGSAASCGCLTAEPCGSFCSGDGATGLTLTCPGG